MFDLNGADPMSQHFKLGRFSKKKNWEIVITGVGGGGSVVVVVVVTEFSFGYQFKTQRLHLTKAHNSARIFDK